MGDIERPLTIFLLSLFSGDAAVVNFAKSRPGSSGKPNLRIGKLGTVSSTLPPLYNKILDRTQSRPPGVTNSFNLLDELLAGNLAALPFPPTCRRHWCMVIRNVKRIL